LNVGTLQQLSKLWSGYLPGRMANWNGSEGFPLAGNR
jgi:hypothetical protein